jgi:hypothetical protein
MITPYFENIETEIERRIYHAKTSICIAVAYFTSIEIFDMLLSAIRKGIEVTLIISEDEANFKSSLVFHDLINAGGKVFVVIKESGMMHHKFCIIDGQKVLFGSYNWTSRAKNNLESICVIEEDKDSINAFIQEFQKLLDEGKNLQCPGLLSHIPSGIEAIDNAFNGLGNGKLIIVTASNQKELTQFILSLSSGIWTRGDKAGLVSLVDLETEFTKKLLCIASNVGRHQIQTSKMTEFEFLTLVNVFPKFSQIQGKTVKHLYNPLLKDLLTNIKIAQLHDIIVLFIDGLDEMDLRDFTSTRNNYAEYERVLKEVRHLARSMNIPIVVSLKMKISNHKRNYGRHENDFGLLPELCDTLFHLYEEEYYAIEQDSEGKTFDLHCIKNNNGPDYNIKLSMDINSGAFKTPVPEPVVESDKNDKPKSPLPFWYNNMDEEAPF